MSDRMLPHSASQSATQPCAVDGLPSTSKARAARGIVCSAFVCTLALLLAPAHAAADSASAVLHVRGIDTQSAVRSMRSIGRAQHNPAIALHPAAAALAATPAQTALVMPAQAGIQNAGATGFPPARERRAEIADAAASRGAQAGVHPAAVMPVPSTVMPAQAGIQNAGATGFPPSRERRAEIADAAASRGAQAGVHPAAVMPVPSTVMPVQAQARDLADVTPTPSAVTPTPSTVMPAQAGIQNEPATAFASPTQAFGDDVPAREGRVGASLGGTGRPSTYSQPLLAAVQQAQQPAPSAVIAQSEIGAGNNILLPRAWYDTTPGRIGIFIGASAVASLADRGVKDWALRHQNSAFSRDVIKARDILPWPAFWFAAATSFPSPWANDKLAHTSTVALGAGVLDSVETLALKAVIGRDRPGDSNSPYNFTPFNPRYGLIIGGSSFPSGHTSLTWALITPYARAYHMPWLYALGVASGTGRVMQNAHWFSDVVGGGLLGYFTARWTEEHMDSKANVQWVFTGNGLYMFKSF